MISFILAGRRKLPPNPPPSTSETYDPVRQLWIDSESGEPLVSRLQRSPSGSQYGETSITETREGTDQSKGSLQASPYGETSMTKTQEGADQTEVSSILVSTHGETVMTFTREGTDQTGVRSRHLRMAKRSQPEREKGLIKRRYRLKHLPTCGSGINGQTLEYRI